MTVLPNKNSFFEIIKDFEYIPYPQTEGWYNYLACTQPNPSEKFIFLVDNLENPTIACFGFIMKFAWLKMLIIEGECIKTLPINRKIIQPFYEKITTLNFDFVEINSHAHYTPEFEIGIRKSGYLRPVGLFSNHLSKIINVQEEIQISRNWKRNLKKAEICNLIFNVTSVISQNDVIIFKQLYDDLSVDKKFHSQIKVEQLENLFQFEEFQLANVMSNDKIDVSFIYRINKDIVEPLFIAKSMDAKNKGATFFMYIKLLEYLKNKKVLYFDIGRLAPSTISSLQGVFNFKDSIEGKYVIYNGEWSWHKKKYYRPLIYFVKKYLLRKREA